MRKRISHKLTIEQKKEIWRLYNDKYSPTDIAKKFGISRMTVYKIGKGEEPKCQEEQN